MRKYKDSNYSVTEDGRVFKNTKELSYSINVRGYKILKVTLHGRQFNKKVHRLVAETFIPNPNNYSDVNHIDGDKLNNHVSNLEWCTRKYNINHSYKLGLSKTGEYRYNAKLTNDDCSEIFEAHEAGISQRDIAKHYNVSQPTISGILSRKRYAYQDRK